MTNDKCILIQTINEQHNAPQFKLICQGLLQSKQVLESRKISIVCKMNKKYICGSKSSYSYVISSYSSL